MQMHKLLIHSLVILNLKFAQLIAELNYYGYHLKPLFSISREYIFFTIVYNHVTITETFNITVDILR